MVGRWPRNSSRRALARSVLVIAVCIVIAGSVGTAVACGTWGGGGGGSGCGDGGSTGWHGQDSSADRYHHRDGNCPPPTSTA